MKNDLYGHVSEIKIQSMVTSIFTKCINVNNPIKYFFYWIINIIQTYLNSSFSFKDVDRYIYVPKSSDEENKKLIDLNIYLEKSLYFRCFMREIDSNRNIYVFIIFSISRKFRFEAVQTIMIFSQKI